MINALATVGAFTLATLLVIGIIVASDIVKIQNENRRKNR